MSQPRIRITTPPFDPSSVTAAYTSTVKHLVKAGVAVTKGQAVYVTGSTGNSGTNMIIGKASNNGEPTSSKTLGLVESSLSINEQGYVITEGLLAGLNTSGASAGDPVWLGTNGNLIYGLANKPVAPAHLVFIGIVTRAQQNNGEIFVRPQNGFELEELHNLVLTNVQNGDSIVWDSTTSKWINSTIVGQPGATGPTGATGADGADGADGLSAYQVAVTNGFVGTEQQWLDSLVGPAGADGVDGAPGTPGADGAQGPKGDQGDPGPAGADGVDGAPGTPGADGVDGLSAYQVAVANGFVGTEQQWLDSLVGPTGATGPKGDTGATGAAGTNGVDGLGYDGVTSSTSMTVGTGTKTFTVNKTGAFIAGSRVRVFPTLNYPSYMEGNITSISGTSWNIEVTNIGYNEGVSFSSWKISLAGLVGPSPDTSTYATLTDSQTLTNKTLTAPTFTGAVKSGSGTFTKQPADGDIAFDSGVTDTPGVLFYTANNTNWGIDSADGDLRFVKNLNEVGGAVKASINPSGNLYVAGTINGVTLNNDAWTSFTPALSTESGTWTIGNGSIEAAYKLIGKTCHFKAKIVIGSTTSIGAGTVNIGLPFTAASGNYQFAGSMLDAGNAWYQVTGNGMYLNSTTKFAMICNSGGTGTSSQGVTNSFPFSLLSGDYISISGTYEIA